MPFSVSRRAVVSLALAFAVFGGLTPLSAQPSAEPGQPREWTPAASFPLTDGGWVTSLAVSPDGQQLAIGRQDAVQFFDLARRELGAALKSKWGRVQALAYSPDGKQLAVGGYQSLQLWDVGTQSLVRDLKGHRGTITAAAFSPDGLRLVSTSDDESARLWTLADGSSQVLGGQNFPMNDVVWSADGQHIATASGDELRPTKGGEVVVRDASGAPQATFKDHTRAALSVAFSPKEKALITGGLDERVLTYDGPEWKLAKTLEFHGRPVNGLVVHPAGKIVFSIAGGRAKGGHALRAWDLSSGAELAMGTAHSEKILALAMAPDGRTVVTGGQDGAILIWETAFLDPEAVASTATVEKPAAVIRVGVIGLDTSHAPAFAKLLNDPQAAEDVAGCRIVAAYPKGSPDIESSTRRVPGYTKEFQDMGIEIVDSIPALLEKVDCVLLETNDGRPHLEQVLPVLMAKKRCFIDKPVAGSLADAVAIYEASKKYETPIFSCSSLRFMPVAQEVRNGKVGQVLGCDAFSPCSLEMTHPDLFWYGIHGVEILYTVMGGGCESVSRVHTDDFDVAMGTWSDGRVGTFRGIRRGASGYGGRAFGDKGMTDLGAFGGYRPLAVEIVKFFKTGEVPVTPEETLELYAFMEAADESRRQGGAPVKVQDVLQKAREAAAKADR